MLGEKIWEATGKVIGQRVLAGDGTGPKAEITYGGSGYLLGVEGTSVATYWEAVRPDGTRYGEGQGIYTAKDGSTVSWTANGVGKTTPEGVANYRGVVYFQTTSPQFARLNGLCGITEHETDAVGDSHGVVWEWK
jgi:hypothetical protein